MWKNEIRSLDHTVYQKSIPVPRGLEKNLKETPLPSCHIKDFLNKILHKTCKGREKQAQIKQGMVGSVK